MDNLDKQNNNLGELKKEYEKLRVKYNLPDFNDLNKLFDIEEIGFETDFLLRKIRRVVSEKALGYSKFVEIILNPSNAPFFFFKLIKKLDSKDREILSGLYEELGNFEVEIIALDLDYSEKKEADFINKLFKIFNESVREKLLDVVKKLSNGTGDKKADIGGS